MRSAWHFSRPQFFEASPVLANWLARMAELERELADVRAAVQKAIAELREASSMPRRDRKAYMREFMRRRRAAAKDRAT